MSVHSDGDIVMAGCFDRVRMICPVSDTSDARPAFNGKDVISAGLRTEPRIMLSAFFVR